MKDGRGMYACSILRGRVSTSTLEREQNENMISKVIGWPNWQGCAVRGVLGGLRRVLCLCYCFVLVLYYWQGLVALNV